MTIAIITEDGVRKVAPMVVLAQQAAALAQQSAALAQQSAGIAAAVAAERYYASYAAGNAATTTGQYFAVLASGAYDFHIHGNATPVVKMPVLDGSGNLGVGTSSPSSKGHFSGANATVLTVESTNGSATDTSLRLLTPDRDWRIGQNIGSLAIGAFSIYDFTAGAHRFVIDGDGIVRPGADNTQSLGAASFSWSVVYAGTGSINTSDRDAKTDIGTIPDEWLDAWADVQWSRFKFVDGTRWHVGLVAQQVHEAFAAHDIDAFDIGLCCFDEWEAEPEVRDDEGELIRPALEAGSRWGLRYSECEAMEAAYQRRRIAQLEAQVAAL